MSHPISDRICEALVMAALLGGVGMAFAQAPAAPQTGDVTPAQAPKVPGHEGVEEPAAKQAPSPAVGIFVNGKLNVPGAPADTSTTPANFSSVNDRLDNLPLMARGPELTDAQRKLIRDLVKVEGTGEPARSASPTTMLPASVDMQAWPDEVVRQIPDIGGTKYVGLPDKILVVRPENRIVVAEIGR